MNKLPRISVAISLAVLLGSDPGFLGSDPAGFSVLRPRSDRSGLEEKLSPTRAQRTTELKEQEEVLLAAERDGRPMQVYVKQLAIGRSPRNWQYHHMGAVVSLSPQGDPIGLLPLSSFAPDKNVRVSAKLHLLSWHRKTKEPMEVVIERRGKKHHAGQHMDFIFRATRLLAASDFRQPASRAGLEEQGEGSQPRASARDWLNYGLDREQKGDTEEAVAAFENALKADRSMTEAWVGLTRAIIAARKPPASTAGRDPWSQRTAQYHSVWARFMEEAAARGTDSETLLKILGEHQRAFARIGLTPDQFLTILLGPPQWRGSEVSYLWDELALERTWLLGGFAATAVEIRSTHPVQIREHLGLRLKRLGFTGQHFRSSSRDQEQMIRRMFDALQVRTGLEEERGRELVRIAGREMPSNGSGIVVLEVELLNDPAWAAAARTMAGDVWQPFFYHRVVFWGEPPEEIKGELRWATTREVLMGHLARIQEQNPHQTHVFFLGSASEAEVVRSAIPPTFVYVPMIPSEFAFLVGLGIPQERAVEMAAGLEEASVLGRQL